jgi:hypothetical protein
MLKTGMALKKGLGVRCMTARKAAVELIQVPGKDVFPIWAYFHFPVIIWGRMYIGKNTAKLFNIIHKVRKCKHSITGFHHLQTCFAPEECRNIKLVPMFGASGNIFERRRWLVRGLGGWLSYEHWLLSCQLGICDR